MTSNKFSKQALDCYAMVRQTMFEVMELPRDHAIMTIMDMKTRIFILEEFLKIENKNQAFDEFEQKIKSELESEDFLKFVEQVAVSELKNKKSNIIIN